MAHDRQPSVKVGAKNTMLCSGVWIKRPENRVRHQANSISLPTGRSQPLC
jgi:hypothetical protein